MKVDEPARARVRRLSANGQCYFCPKKFSWDHKCTARGGVFSISMADSEDEGADISEEDVRISLHELTGVTSGDTICLRVQVNDIELTALVDSGSTHSFIHHDTARRVGLDISSRPGLTVTVANGEQLRSPRIYASTLFSIHDEPFSIDYYALALHGCDVVLGVQWLKTLGPIMWDFKALSMVLWYHGRAFLWNGIDGAGFSLAALTATQDLMEVPLQDYTDLFAEPWGWHQLDAMITAST